MPVVIDEVMDRATRTCQSGWCHSLKLTLHTRQIEELRCCVYSRTDTAGLGLFERSQSFLGQATFRVQRIARLVENYRQDLLERKSISLFPF